ncbi:MAG: cysteine synthase family protein [Candidatus Cloacimonetes bacterium]|nr:cysteine synthase family protein [Candidatus Cloacimonadota bacterium]
MEKPQKKLAELENLVGNTPLIEISFKFKGVERKMYVKLEFYNYTGSIKDRMALNCLRRAYQLGQIKEGYTIAETTSGNTGIAFSAQGSYLGHECMIFMPDWMSEERIKMMKSFGATVRLVSREEGGFLGCIQKTKDFAMQGNVYIPDQFVNPFNVEAHYTGTGPELLKQVNKLGIKIDGFVSGVGTGGTLMGVGKYLRSIDPKIRIFPMEPKSSPTLSTGHQVGKHRIAGISDEFIPAIMDLNFCDEIIMADCGDSIIMAQKLSKILGLGVGISSGANFIAAIKAADLIGKKANIATVFSDDNKKYFSTDYAKEEPIKEGFLSSVIELLGFKVIR